MGGLAGNMQVDRRKILISLIGSAPLAALSVAGARDSTKVSQSAAHFQPTPKDGQSCAQCYSFVAPRMCKLVDGEVSPNGRCGLWTQRAS